MPNKANQDAVAELTELFKGATAIFVSHNKSLTVEEATELRKKIREAKAKHRVAKNTLAAIAAKATKLDAMNNFLTGPTMLTICMGDVTAAAKALASYAKDHEHLVLVGGVVDGKEVSKADIEALATLPPREVLLAKLVGSMNSPIRRLAVVLNRPASGLVIALNGVAQKKAA
jgi:large subunit ribosomal protein L10